MNILVVDDSKAMRMIVMRTLRQAGFGKHRVVEAVNGSEAMDKLRDEVVHLILSDWNMPKMTGLELLQAIRQAGQVVPFGFITTESSEKMRQAAHEAGADFLISKPFTADSFQQTLGAHLT